MFDLGKREYLNVRELATFASVAGLLAIFFDALIAHGLFWDNDPYWTYWIAKTLLIIAVFIAGTAFIGIGITQGIILSAIHSVLISIVYQWFTPVGIPREPEWLDFYHVWATGVPVHFLVVLTGYFFMLWVWQRHPHEYPERKERVDIRYVKQILFGAIIASIIATLVDLVFTQLILLQEFPGITYLMEHLVIGFVFIYVWLAFIGLDLRSLLVGALMLSFSWTAYSLYLGPKGLPFDPPRYVKFADLWLIEFPGGFVSSLVALTASYFFLRRFTPFNIKRGKKLMVLIGILVPILMTSSPFLHAQSIEEEPYIYSKAPTSLKPGNSIEALNRDFNEGRVARASASGTALFAVGANPYDPDTRESVEGKIDIITSNMGKRWSSIQNTDKIDVRAEFDVGDDHYEVYSDLAMANHPLALYTTWSGVTYRHEMHGQTWIGTQEIPKVKPDIALWGWGEVRRNGRVINKMAPLHVMVISEGPMTGIELEVAAETKSLVGVPNGYLLVKWPSVHSLELPRFYMHLHEVLGAIALLLLVGLFYWLAKNERNLTR